MIKLKQEINICLSLLVVLAACSTQSGIQNKSKIGWDDPNPFKNSAQHSFESPEAKGDQRLLFLFSGHTMGEIDICGCSMNPKGGLDRRLNFVRSLRNQKSIPVMVFDSGNALFATEEIQKSQLKKAEARADLIFESYSAMLMSAVNVGTLDLSLGVQKLKDLAKKNSINLISSNLTDSSGKLLFEKEFSTNIGKQQILVLGVSLGSDSTVKKGIKALDPVETVLSRIKDIPSTTTVLILSDMGQTKDEELAKKTNRALLIVGSRETFSLEIPLHVNNSLIMRPHFQGQQWSRFEVEWKSKAESWYNFMMAQSFEVLWDARKKSYFEHAQSKESSESKKGETDYIESSRKEMLDYYPGDIRKSTFYSYDTISLTEEYSKPNEFSPKIKKLVKP